MIRSSRTLAACLVAAVVSLKLAAPVGAADPVAIPRILPPAGIAVPDDKRKELETRLDKLRTRLDALADKLKGQPKAKWIADVEVLYKAPETALRFGEFYDPKEFDQALQQVKLGEERCTELEAGEASWRRATGLVVRGYRSTLDDSYQPYGVVIPKTLDLTKTHPLYVFLHGRGEKMTDLAFVSQRLSKPGDVLPQNAIVLHPFGRYCNGWKYAGEVDALEAIAAVQDQYKIDPDRIVLVGFSMGGAGAWVVGAHYTDHFCAIAPGAGFAETALFTKLTPEKFPADYEQVLWGLTDVPNYVRNLFNVPTIAYSGELDKQIQAARVMEEAFTKEGRTLPHLIGPKTEHKYHPETLAELMKQLDAAVTAGRPKQPTEVHLQTKTLRYAKMFWIQALALDRHWVDARIDAKIDPATGVTVETKNIHMFAIDASQKDTALAKAKQLIVDGQPIEVPTSLQGKQLVLVRNPDRWILDHEHGGMLIVGGSPDSAPPRKFPGLQGPIDDAFIERFVVVIPTGTAASPAVEAWTNTEVAHLIDRWRRFWRGDVRVIRDVDVTADDYKNANLVCFGDVKSNKVLAEAAKHLPIAWTGDSFRIGEQTYDATKNVPLLIYPNPLNQKKYLVVNSGPTFREASDRSNANQTSKLPDWAVVDATTTPDDQRPGKVLAAGFFDEYWKYSADAPKPHTPALAKP